MSITSEKNGESIKTGKELYCVFFTQKIELIMIIESLRRELVREMGPERA